MNNRTLVDLDDNNNNIPYFEASSQHNRLQWLIILIPVVVLFLLYTFIRIHNKRRSATRQRLDGEASLAVPPHVLAMSNVIPVPVPAPAYTRSNHINTLPTYTTSSGPLLRFSNNNTRNNYNTNMLWQMFHSDSSVAETSSHSNSQGRRRRRRELRRTPTPPPVYSISSPPKYKEVVGLEREEPLAEVQSRICTAS